MPTGIDSLIQSGLQNRTASRPQSVAEYRQKLNAAIGSAPIGGKKRTDVDRFVGGDDPPKKHNWWIIGGGIFAGFLVLGVIGNMIDQTEPGILKNGNVITSTGGREDDPPPPPPPPLPSYSQLSGQWLDGNGAGIAADVNANGTFSGTGRATDGTPFTIQGAFSGTVANYTVTNTAGALGGRLAWDGRNCHLDFRTLYPNGAIAVQGQFHVNHAPGEPCPAGWGANGP